MRYLLLVLALLVMFAVPAMAADSDPVTIDVTITDFYTITVTGGPITFTFDGPEDYTTPPEFTGLTLSGVTNDSTAKIYMTVTEGANWSGYGVAFEAWDFDTSSDSWEDEDTWEIEFGAGAYTYDYADDGLKFRLTGVDYAENDVADGSVVFTATSA
ncbi:MAG: hypothetical protein HRF49_01040 [bacterium]|jgi:opacity protein-like surface antigen